MRIGKVFSQYIGKYLSTRVVFFMDLLVSVAASLLTLVLVNYITVRSLFDLKPFCLWMVLRSWLHLHSYGRCTPIEWSSVT